MASPAPLFTIPIPPCTPAHPGGSVVCTEPQSGIYLLTFSSPPDNRLTPSFCGAMLAALDAVEFGGRPPGVVVTTSAIPKFYSNGLDLGLARDMGDPFWEGSLWPLFRRLLTYPMPTVALLNGHAFAGGLMLAMHHDYRVFNPSRGFLCLNELDFGAPLKPAMSGIFRVKLGGGAAYRSLVLEAKRFGGPEALAAGIVDVLGGLPEAVALVEGRELRKKGATGVYGLMKAEMYKEAVDLLDSHAREEERERKLFEAEDARKEKGQKAVDEWKKSGGKSKL
ncbi:Enoyl-CoA hydratase/isomerase [Pleurostoma richardsiae]|uniref:Enoyl-CoA hydratase/isomerase n=1 Tax=Pleurostoma richardsiae TaxID=41990 RepID=A0AA38RK89_9PEZI|nr:Enoyl-CoA hydratase/isomerase [Pleurostoma richardsiae]